MARVLTMIGADSGTVDRPEQLGNDRAFFTHDAIRILSLSSGPQAKGVELLCQKSGSFLFLVAS